MRDLVADIKVGTQERHVFVGGVVKDVKGLLARFERERGDVRKEIKELAAEIKKFLAESEKARGADFGVMMKDIAERLDSIKKWQHGVRKDTRDLMKEYAADSQKARDLWTSLSKKETAAS